MIVNCNNAGVVCPSTADNPQEDYGPPPPPPPPGDYSNNPFDTSLYVLGAFNMNPWGAGNFADQGAVWIWNDPNAASSTIANVWGTPDCVNFIKVVDVTQTTSVIVHIIADDNSQLRINDQLIGDANGGWANQNYPKLATVLQRGRNVIRIQAWNGSVGPAGLLASIIANGSVLAHTDTSWSASISVCDELAPV